MSSKDKPRKGEEGPLPQRRSRTFFKGDGWYFMTREHIDVGPFASQELAEIGVQDYAGFSMDADRANYEAAHESAEIVHDESGL